VYCLGPDDWQAPPNSPNNKTNISQNFLYEQIFKNILLL